MPKTVLAAAVNLVRCKLLSKAMNSSSTRPRTANVRKPPAAARVLSRGTDSLTGDPLAPALSAEAMSANSGVTSSVCHGSSADRRTRLSPGIRPDLRLRRRASVLRARKIRPLGKRIYHRSLLVAMNALLLEVQELTQTYIL